MQRYQHSLSGPCSLAGFLSMPTYGSGGGGDSGRDGFSPRIRVKVDTPDTYILTITTIEGSFDTPNLKGGRAASSDVPTEAPRLETFIFNTDNGATSGGARDDGNLYLEFEGAEPPIYVSDNDLMFEYDGEEPNMYIDDNTGDLMMEVA